MILDEVKISRIQRLIHDHFPQITEKDLITEIATHAQEIKCSAGEILMDYGSYVKMVPLIYKGGIKVTREDPDEGREIILYFLQSGDTCSMSFSCCMTNKRSEIRTEAIEDSELLGVPIQYVDKWMTQYQSWKNFVMMSYDQRMVEMVSSIDSIAFEGLDERLMKYLEARSQVIASSDNIIAMTHQEIANDLNSSREAISRLLKKLEHQGKVELHRNRIILLAEE